MGDPRLDDDEYTVLPPPIPIDADDEEEDEESKAAAAPAKAPAQPPKVLPRIQYQPPPDAPPPEPSPGGRPAKTKKTRDRAVDSREPVESRRSYSGGDATAPSSKPKPERRKPKEPDADKPRKGVLIEETPEFDTVETRTRIRMAIGAVASVVIVLMIILVFRQFLGESTPEGEPAPEPVMGGLNQPPGPPAESKLEAQAMQMLDDARRDEKSGKIDLALKRLDRLIDAYPKSESAKEAQAAKDRHVQGLPLFPDGPTVIAQKASPPKPAPPVESDPQPGPGEVAVAAQPPMPPVHEPGGDAAKAEVTPGPLPPEPFRETGLPRPAAGAAAHAVPAGFHARSEAGVHTSGWPQEITCDRDGSAMVLVPGGTFTMGRDDGDPAQRPAHKVTLSPYYIDQHEITVRQFALFRGRPPGDDDRPVVNVTYKDASDYAQWAGKALPTEAQWEMAARTIDGRPHPWGGDAPRWTRPRQPKQIDSVMSFPTDMSPYGVFDLAGNAWEWTADLFDTKYYQQLRGGTPGVDPTGPARMRSGRPVHAVKGGSKDWDVAWRSGLGPEARFPYLGFRCVLRVTGAGNAPAPGPGPGTPGSNPTVGSGENRPF